MLDALKTLGDKHLDLKDAEDAGPGNMRVYRDLISDSSGNVEDSSQ